MDLVAKIFALEADNSRYRQALLEIRELEPDHLITQIVDRALKEEK